MFQWHIFYLFKMKDAIEFYSISHITLKPLLFSSDWVKVEGHEGYSEMDLQIFFISYHVQCICTNISTQSTNKYPKCKFLVLSKYIQIHVVHIYPVRDIYTKHK